MLRFYIVFEKRAMNGSPPTPVCLRNLEVIMLWTIILILLVLWALGFGFAGSTVGGFVHILLVIAVIVLVVQLITGRRG